MNMRSARLLGTANAAGLAVVVGYMAIAVAFVLLTHTVAPEKISVGPLTPARLEMAVDILFVAVSAAVVWVLQAVLNRRQKDLEARLRQADAEIAELRQLHLLSDSERDRVERFLDALSNANRAIVSAHSAEAILESVCREMAAATRLPLVWFARCNEVGTEKTITHAVAAGPEAAAADGARFMWDDSPEAHNPLGIAVKTGYVQLVTYPSDALRRLGPALGAFKAVVIVPIVYGGRVLGAFAFHSHDDTAFQRRELEVLHTLALDISYALRVVSDLPRLAEISSDRDKAKARVDRLIRNSIEALADVVEQRDPYTAGHQKRVSKIAVAIGRAMELPLQRIDNLAMAAMVHDIGKISVPSDVLAKPRRLTAAEMDLIKGHPEVGYQILSRLELDQPIARITREHHERIDGTGYPQGLRGEQIMLEARILAVADTAEAIISHRPYRPGLGMLKAREIITAQRGKALDPMVVDALMGLFETLPAIIDPGTGQDPAHPGPTA